MAKIDALESSQIQKYAEIKKSNESTVASVRGMRKELEAALRDTKIDLTSSLTNELVKSNAASALTLDKATKGISHRLDTALNDLTQEAKAQRKDLDALRSNLTSKFELVREQMEEARKLLAKIELRPKTEVSDIAGTWRLIGLERNEKKIGVDEKSPVTFEFRKQQVVMEEKAKETEKVMALFTVYDAEAAENAIDFYFAGKHALSVIPPVNKEMMLHGAYHLDKSHDRLTLLIFDGNRPKSFDFSRSKNASLLQFQREKKKMPSGN